MPLRVKKGGGLSGGLDRRLSPLPNGFVHLMVGKSIVLMNRKSGIVIDLIADVII